MKIYTKVGDAGDTALFGGGTRSKDDLQVCAYGSVDELNAQLGVARAVGVPADFDEVLLRIQGELFVVGAELATSRGQEEKLKLPLIGPSHIAALEKSIDQMEGELPALKHFILPGGGQAGAALHVARTVCRRAERQYVALARSSTDPWPRSELGIYLNRLSDFLFVLARYCNLRGKIADVPWQP